ncbi:hypothetical protein F4819DRAFT_263402 [Hypoxylon fuscum]|nr:hypothetical protein F4819DRAFT_263402 [Hypoxylon fuscum]
MSLVVAPPPIMPVPFQYDEYQDDSQTLPDLDDEELDDITAVLKALAKGSYPRLDAVPLALNAYNCNWESDGDEDRPWAYFHEITTITPEGTPLKQRPQILLDGRIRDDLKRPWTSIRTGHKFGEAGEGSSASPNSAKYRFLCFIHRHRIDRRATAQKGVHTMSIWDREWDELTWHDTYHVSRPARRREIQRFWALVAAPGLIGKHEKREAFVGRIRYRTVYHASERLEDALRAPVPPRHTLWAVLGAALFHMNGARDPHVSIVPDRLELFGGHAKDLLPRLFARLLCLCLDCRPRWTRPEQERFVAQFRILDRLRWMRVYARKHLERRGAAEAEDGVAGERDWMYAILKI